MHMKHSVVYEYIKMYKLDQEIVQELIEKK